MELSGKILSFDKPKPPMSINKPLLTDETEKDFNYENMEFRLKAPRHLVKSI